MRRLRGWPRRLLILLALAAGIGWLIGGAFLPAGQDPAPVAGQEQISGSTPLPATPTPLATGSAPIENNTPRAAPTEAPAGVFVSRELVTTTLAAPLIPPPDGPAAGVALSADGRWLAFSSRAGNLSSTIQDTNGYDDVYLYDRETGELTLVSAGVEGGPGDGGSGPPTLSPDGRFVAFYAWASDLIPGDSNAVQDAFLYDRATGNLERVSVDSDGRQANGRAGDAAGARPAFSWDGRLVAFQAEATNLVPDDRNGVTDVFVHDRLTRATTRISLGADGQEADGASARPALSGDGRLVVFQSTATNLDPALPSPGGISQIYLHDRESGRTVLLSRGVDGRPGNGDSIDPVISGDGQVVAFTSAASNLVAGDTNGVADVFVLDRETGVLTRASVTSMGVQANREAGLPSLSLDGRVVTFVSTATNLVNGDTNGAADLFLYDRLSRHTSRVSVAVTGPWTGRQANGPSMGPAAIAAGGRLIAFVSAATDLVPAGASHGRSAHSNLYLHSRVEPPLYTLSGRVLEVSRAPLAGVEVAAGPHRTVTGPDGRYTLPYLVGGTYTLAVAKPGYTFSPPRRTISLLADQPDQDFIGFPGGDPAAFLDLPLAYDGQAATMLQLLRDTDEGGLVDSWFDHDAPDYSKNGAVLLWDGRARRLQPYNETLGCFERRCYDGHDGIDFPYRDPVPATDIFEPLMVYPAAGGLVAAVHRDCTDAMRGCNGGYGNEVILYHDNGYFTRYSHLDEVAIAEDPLSAGPVWLSRETPLGVVGSTGNSYGAHLHFAVHQDNGNGRWDGGEVDRPVDPFGWAGGQPDPWATVGAASRRLWRYSPTAEAVLFGSQGATLRDGAGSVTANIPAAAFGGQVRVELTTGSPPALPLHPLRSLGRAFSLRVLDWLAGAPVETDNALTRPVELAVVYQGAETRHLALEQLMLYRWEPAAQRWTPLPTVVDDAAQVIYAASDRLGEFDLLAPLRCPADQLEPDDDYFTAVFVEPGHPPLSRLLDVAGDEDWLRLNAAAGSTYQVTVDQQAEGVSLNVEVYDTDGLTRLATATSGTLTWTAAEEGVYFVRVAPAPGSATGCTATYRVAVQPVPPE